MCTPAARPLDPTSIDFGAIVEATLPDWDVGRPAPDDPTGPVWVHARPHDAPELPDQGWKLHVSATITNATDVLDVALGILGPSGTCFKVAWHGSFLARLNAGLDGPTQVGKFITVYPADDDTAVDLTRALARATAAFDAPAVPTDRRIGTTPVHYRYGTFAGRHIQNALGQPQSGLVDADGRQRLDTRSMRYRRPDWVDDPFEAAGIDVATTAPGGHVLDGRFLRLTPIVVGARGSVHRGIDLHEGTRVVLKTARSAASVAVDGSDAVARLHHEAAMLAALAPQAGAPALVSVGVAGDDTYLAMEEIVGTAASTIVAEAQHEGRCLARDDVRRWVLDIAAVLSLVHAGGHVYRDLKLANVMIEESTGRARLVDFELMTPIGAPGQGEAGSRGYLAPTTGTGAVTVADDVYAFGAFVWALATTNEPSFQPVPDDLDRLDPYLLEPGADPALLAMARCCRDPDPDRRPATIDDALALLHDAAPRRTAARPGAPVDWHTHAVAAGHALVMRGVETTGGGLVWPSVRRIGGGIALRTIYEGAAGIVLALAGLVAAGETGFVDPLRRAIHWLVHDDDGIDHVPGLLSGEMGVAVALAIAGDVLDDAALTRHGGAIARSLPDGADIGPDLVMGIAGLARGHLVLAELTGEAHHTALAARIGQDLIAAADIDADGARWRLPMSLPRLADRACYGYGHGAAGITDVLLDLAAATGDHTFGDCAHEALDWIGHGALERPHGVDWPEYPGADPFGAWWCHGAAGIAPVLARGERTDLARRAGRHTARMTWALPNRCHGLAGGIETLLSTGELLGDDEPAQAAERLGRLLVQWQIAPGIWPGESADVVTPDYMVGLAGVIPALLRLAGRPTIDPTITPLAGPLTVRG